MNTELLKFKLLEAAFNGSLTHADTSKWEQVKLGDACKHQNGDRGKNYPSKSKLSHSGIPFISALNLTNNTVIDDDRLLKMTEEQFNKLGNGKLHKGDFVLCIRGSVGKHGIYPFDKGAIASSLVILRPIEGKLDLMWLSFYFDSSLFKDSLLESQNGTAQPNLAANELMQFIIPLPTLEEQKQIVSTLEEGLAVIDAIADAKENLATTAELLRSKILHAAIQGCLVSQDPNDEPASVLLEKIREEKKRLVKEGKLKKKDLEENPISEEEIPFEIPESWEWCRFGEIVNMKMGKTPPRGDSIYWEDGAHSWVSISDMLDYGHINKTKEKVSEYAAGHVFKEESPIGTLLMSFKLTIGRTSILDVPAFHNEAIISVFPYEGDNNNLRDYLFYLLPLLSNWGNSKDAIKGKTLNSSSLNNLIIPLPPLAEQKRIVEKIEVLFMEIDKLTK